jgi:hypothetical protein
VPPIDTSVWQFYSHTSSHMIAFDGADETIRAYEIKRGNGQFDAGKIRSITRDLKCIQVLLKGYGEVANLKRRRRNQRSSSTTAASQFRAPGRW